MKNFFKKLDLKSWLILAFLVTTLFFGALWYFKGDSGSKEVIKNLEKENKELRSQREVNKEDIKQLRKEVSSLKESLKINQAIQDSLNQQLELQDQQILESKSQLDSIKKEISKKEDQIQNIINNPRERTGTDLLNSLNGKLNK